MEAKRLYIIAGCNGAGKTTASKQFLPSVLNCKQWVNADEIAVGLSPLAPESVAVQAGRLMLERIQELLSQNVTFAIETTLTTRSYRNLVLQAQSLGYEVELVFFFLPSPEVAINRVAHRVRNGGHSVPDDIVRRRYYGRVKNLKEIFMPIVDKWSIFRYENDDYHLIASGRKGEVYDLANHIAMEEQTTYSASQLERFLAACNKAVLDMITECALHDELVVMIDKKDRPIWVRAREVLEKNPGLKRRDVEYTPIEVDLKEIVKQRT